MVDINIRECWSRLQQLIYLAFMDLAGKNLTEDDPLGLDSYDIIYLVISVISAFITIFYVYKWKKESIISRKRPIAIELSSTIACILAYIKDCYKLENTLVKSFSLDLCTSSISINVLLPQGVVGWYAFSKEKFYALEDQAKLLASTLGDKFVKKKLDELPELRGIYKESIEECGKTKVTKEVSMIFSILVNVLKYLIKEYSISIDDIKHKCQGLLD